MIPKPPINDDFKSLSCINDAWGTSEMPLPKNYKHSLETRQKISEGVRRAYQNPEYRKKIKEAAKRQWERMTPEERNEIVKKMSEAHKRREPIPLENPLPCYFCGELITKQGKNGDCLSIHSLDGNHENWSPENKVSVHRSCHASNHDKRRTMSDTGREKCREAAKRQWKQLTPEGKIDLVNKHRDGIRNYWNNVTPEERAEHGRKVSEGRKIHH